MYDKGSFVTLISSSILGEGDGPNELVNFTHMSISSSNGKIRSIEPTFQLTTSPLGSLTPKGDDWNV